MLYCKSLIYNAMRQEVITPIHPNRLVKWDVEGVPQQVGQQLVPVHWPLIPQIALLPDQERFAIAHNGIQQSYIDIYNWVDLRLIEQIAVPHAAYEEIGTDDPFCRHDRVCRLSHLSVTPCGTYLVAVEQTGDTHLLALENRTWIRLKRRFPDISEDVAFDHRMQFMVAEYLITDALYTLYRIDDLAQDQMTVLGKFEGVAGCHRGQFSFQMDGRAIARTGYRCDIDYYTIDFDRQVNVPVGTDLCDAQPPVLTKQWTQQLPYIQHPHSLHHPWQSSLVFQNASTLLFAAGRAIVQIRLTDGKVLSEYCADDMITAIANDAERHRVIAATDRGVITAAIATFDPELPYLNLLPSQSRLPPADAAQSSQLSQTASPDSLETSAPSLSPLATKVFVWLLGLISVGCLTALLAPSVLFLVADNLSEVITDRTYTVGPYQLQEKIYRRSGWPDNRYERVYTLQRRGKRIELGRFENEDDRGIGIRAAQPKIVGEWLVVLSANHTYLWKPGQAAIEFNPYAAENWQEYSSLGINGHYDYHAVDFRVEGDRWIFEYRCAHQPCLKMNNNQPMPSRILFYSGDRGKTFHLMPTSITGKSAEVSGDFSNRSNFRTE